MASVTVQKSITYGTGYDITATVVIPVSLVYRDEYILSPSSSTQLIQNEQRPVATGDIKYLFIYNSGSNSAYVAIEDFAGDAVMHEIPAGTVWDSFGEDIMGSSSDWPTPSRINAIYAKGDTTLKVDIFL